MSNFPWSAWAIPPSHMLLSPPVQSQTEEALLAMEEADYEEKLHAVRRINSNAPVIGKVPADNEKEEFDNGAEEEEADSGEDSEGEDFEQETA